MATIEFKDNNVYLTNVNLLDIAFVIADLLFLLLVLVVAWNSYQYYKSVNGIIILPKIDVALFLLVNLVFFTTSLWTFNFPVINYDLYGVLVVSTVVLVVVLVVVILAKIVLPAIKKQRREIISPNQYAEQAINKINKLPQYFLVLLLVYFHDQDGIFDLFYKILLLILLLALYRILRYTSYDDFCDIPITDEDQLDEYYDNYVLNSVMPLILSISIYTYLILNLYLGAMAIIFLLIPTIYYNYTIRTVSHSTEPGPRKSAIIAKV